MKATVIREFGDFDVLEVEEIPTPEPKAGEVLIKILAAGVNRLEGSIAKTGTKTGQLLANYRLITG